jgi:hypothetical protein
MESGSSWPFESLRVLSNVEGLTALSRSKEYRTMKGMQVYEFLRSRQLWRDENTHWAGVKYTLESMDWDARYGAPVA